MGEASRFESLFEQAWRREPGVAAAGGPPLEPSAPVPAPHRVAPWETFRRLEIVARDQLGPRFAGLVPLFAGLERLVGSLFPPDHPSEVYGEEREKKQKELRSALNQLEDLLQALQLPARRH